MKGKKLLFLLLTTLPIIAGCDQNILNSNSSLSNEKNSETETIAQTNSETNTETSTNIEVKVGFSEEDKALLDSYFDFEIPYFDTEYVLYDDTDYYGYTCVIINFNYATENEFSKYLMELNDVFTYDDEGQVDQDYMYYFSIDNFYIDVCYDNYSETYPYIYISIYDKALIDGSGSDSTFDGTQTVNGYFNEEDTLALAEYFDFTVPCVESYYEIYDYSEYYGFTCLLFYFNYTTNENFISLISQIEVIFTAGGSEVADGVTWYKYTNEDFSVEVGYVSSGYNYTYIMMSIIDINNVD